MIHQCISTLSYAVLVNGSPGETFSPSRGIRQGDCLSPYIFIICMEVLSQLLLKAEEQNVIQGFKFKKNSPSISHLFFADDCMLFARASITYARNILKIINVLAKASCQEINFDKSGFFTSGKMHHRHIKLLSKTIGMKFLSSDEKYLGTPLFVGRDKTKSFDFLIDSFYSRLSSTKKTNLNIAGRTVVTKHVLSCLVIYHMACFPLPKSVTSEIDDIQRTFWWFKKKTLDMRLIFVLGGDLGKSNMSGGLGIRNTHATNRVFICKLGWRVLKNPGLLLSSFLKDKYFANQNLLEIDKAAASSSWIWKGIINGLKFLKANSVIKIGNGSSTNIWNSVWIPGMVTPPTSSHPSRSNFTYVSDLIDSHTNNWNLSLLSNPFSHELVIRIRTIRLNLCQKDTIMWAHSKCGNVKISRDNFGLISDAVGAEAAALLLAISWAEEMNLSNVVFVCDCLQLVHFVNGVSCNIKWRNGDLLEQCQSLISRSLSYKLVYVKRLNNKLADRLARRAKSDSIYGLWSPFPPFLNL
ncbi:uncharacterized protein LOC113332813 [Papaver somniferum]|uniref:uncharacterized protein LOC113332813 n=1 Tax=Papaver somniferum TaxID=3469 RepID=UPI000E705DBD|nr:uncharacterized protein LOC113332813 [Papaver somniferum]